MTTMTEAQIYDIVQVVLFWAASGVCFILSAWTIIATIVEVAKGKSKPYHRDVVVGVLFHGGMAVLALKLASLAVNGT